MLINSAQNSSLGKLRVNLLQTELLPEKNLLTLSRVVMVWLLVLFVMIGWFGLAHYSDITLKKKLIALQQENSQYTTQMNTLTEQLTARKVDSKLEDKLATIKLIMGIKQSLHSKLTDPNETYVAGFAAAMNDLAQLHHQDIRLEVININSSSMTFSGLALTPEAVPTWLAGFENSSLLSGKSFSHFKLSENEENITEFMVSSKGKEGSAHE